MNAKAVSRRQFAGTLAAALGYFGLRAGSDLFAQSVDPATMSPAGRVTPSQYDSLIKLCFNENPFGPPKSVLDAMTGALKYANRYGYPDADIVQTIAEHHGVQRENILISAGSTELLDIAASAFLEGRKKVIGSDPTFASVFEWATGTKCGSIRLPLHADFHDDIPAMIQAAKDNRADAGFIYLCNPNNPTAVIVKKGDIQQLLDGIPEGIPVLIDEAYHHFVDNPDYATSIPYVLQGRPVMVTRTFSKIAALAGMRLGYCVAPSEIIARLRPHYDIMSVNALAKWGGTAALKDPAAEQQVKADILRIRRKTTSDLEAMGFTVIPSDANFFMVHLRRDVHPVIHAFRERGILVGRPFPRMLDYLRVSVGSAPEMASFTEAFKEIMA